jgi:hypothetical protein
MGKNIHIVPHGDQWAVKQAGRPTPISTHRTQRAAEDAGRPLARENQSELITHGRNGQIRSKDSYGPDPNPPKDKEH